MSSSRTFPKSTNFDKISTLICDLHPDTIVNDNRSIRHNNSHEITILMCLDFDRSIRNFVDRVVPWLQYSWSVHVFNDRISFNTPDSHEFRCRDQQLRATDTWGSPCRQSMIFDIMIVLYLHAHDKPVSLCMRLHGKLNSIRIPWKNMSYSSIKSDTMYPYPHTPFKLKRKYLIVHKLHDVISFVTSWHPTGDMGMNSSDVTSHVDWKLILPTDISFKFSSDLTLLASTRAIPIFVVAHSVTISRNLFVFTSMEDDSFFAYLSMILWSLTWTPSRSSSLQSWSKKSRFFFATISYSSSFSLIISSITVVLIQFTFLTYASLSWSTSLTWLFIWVILHFISVGRLAPLCNQTFTTTLQYEELYYILSNSLLQEKLFDHDSVDGLIFNTRGTLRILSYDINRSP